MKLKRISTELCEAEERLKLNLSFRIAALHGALKGKFEYEGKPCLGAQDLLEANPKKIDINGSGASGTTALIAAGTNGHVAMVDWLIRQGADVKRKNAQGNDVFVTIERSGAAIKPKELDVASLLIKAYQDKELDLVEALLRFGVNTNAFEDVWPILREHHSSHAIRTLPANAVDLFYREDIKNSPIASVDTSNIRPYSMEQAVDAQDWGEIRKTHDRGYAVFAVKRVKKGQILGIYSGNIVYKDRRAGVMFLVKSKDIIDTVRGKKEMYQGCKNIDLKDDTDHQQVIINAEKIVQWHSYGARMELDPQCSRTLDFYPYLVINPTVFFNTSPSPNGNNLNFIGGIFEGTPCLLIVANRDIQRDSELLLAYGLRYCQNKSADFSILFPEAESSAFVPSKDIS